MCGKKHAMQNRDSADLDKYAGQKVTVKGKLNADTVVVESVTPAK